MPYTNIREHRIFLARLRFEVRFSRRLVRDEPYGSAVYKLVLDRARSPFSTSPRSQIIDILKLYALPIYFLVGILHDWVKNVQWCVPCPFLLRGPTTFLNAASIRPWFFEKTSCLNCCDTKDQPNCSNPASPWRRSRRPELRETRGRAV